MIWYYNMKISKKLIIGFLLVALIAGFMGIFGVVNIRSIAANSNSLYTENTVPLGENGQIQGDFLRIRVNLRQMLIVPKDKRSAISDTIVGLYASMNDNINKLSVNMNTTEEIAIFGDFKKAMENYKQASDKIVNFILNSKEQDAIDLLNGDGAAAGLAADSALQKLYELNLNQAKATALENTNNSSRSELVMIGIIVVTVVVAIVLGLIISNIISKPINNLVKAADSISDGDLNIKLDIETLDEVGQLSKAFEKVIGALNALSSDTNILAQAAIDGNLAMRSSVEKHKGDYRLIVEGFNKTLDAISTPINESRKVLAKMAVNDLTINMVGEYKGMMKEFSVDINSVHTRLSSVVNLLTEISKGETVSLEGIKKIGRRSENDTIMPAMIRVMETIESLVKEASDIAEQASNGNLEGRSDISKFQGGYRKILEGFNMTLDAVEAPIQEASEVLKEMESGNLGESMQGNYFGSYKIIKTSLNNTIDAFNELLGNITEASDQVLSGSTQVSDGSQALSQGTTEQASSIEELTAAITEVAVQTKQNAVNASQANELALNAKQGATQGNIHMKEMLKSMDEINESSSNISKIIKVIDDIAFQTNILALNAAVEAARAGQHGKGFAVVAEEVRNLAARSANAAKETTDLIEGSIKKVEYGTKIANNTAESLDQIVEEVSKAAKLVGEIANASNEQATAISQINKGIEQVSDVVQTNSATAQESAAASEELSSQAFMLKTMVEKFKLKRGNQKYERNVVDGKVNSRVDVSAKRNKLKISLGEKDFGKY